MKYDLDGMWNLPTIQLDLQNHNFYAFYKYYILQ